MDQIYDLIFKFSKINFSISFNNEVFSKKDQKRLKSLILNTIDEIWIDRSYVDYNGTKYENTFILEDGWNTVCTLAIKHMYLKTATIDEIEMLYESFAIIICCYVYQLLSDAQFDIENIYIDIKHKSKFLVEIAYDKDKPYLHYKGKWQTW